MKRRRYVELGAAGAMVLGSFSVARPKPSRPTEGGPEDRSDWQCTFCDDFDGEGLDTDSWSVGWGWGMSTTESPTRVTPENVSVRDSQLVLSGSQDGDAITAGVVNTKNKVTFGPGSYLEARITFARRVGFLNAFWSKPNSEAWPPEIDVVELWQDGSGPDDMHVTQHHLHHSSSTRPGDESTHRDTGIQYRPGDDLTENAHVYAVEWQPDYIVHFVDGIPIRAWTDETMLTAMERGAPFYMMLSLDIDRIGTADRSEEWSEAMVVDWVRLWEERTT